MEKIQNIKTLFDDIKKELTHVTWPDKKDMTTAIIIVSIAVLFSGAIFFGVDYFLYKFVQFLIQV